MPFRQYVVTLSGAAQRLTTALSLSDVPETKNVQAISFQPGSANANPVFIGDSNVSTSAYAFSLAAAATSVPPRAFRMPLAEPANLGDMYVVGTSTEKLHIGVWIR